MAHELQRHKLKFTRQYSFDVDEEGRKRRRWLADFWLTDTKILIEVDGLMYEGRGGHNSVAGVRRDIEKSNRAQELGYTLLRAHGGKGEASISAVAKVAKRLIVGYNKDGDW